MIKNLANKEIYRIHKIENLITDAIKHNSTQKFYYAEKKINTVLSYIPDNPVLLHLLGIVHYHTGRIKTSIAIIVEAIQFCPSNPYFYNSLGSSFKSYSQIKKAEHCYQKALHLKPDYPEALYNIAGIYHMEKNYDKALLYYNQALRVSSGFPEVMNNMAATLNKMNRSEEAIEWCKKAIEIQPNFSEAFNNMGNAYKALGKLESAISCYKDSISFSGNNAEVLCNFANALNDKGNVEEAITVYKKAIKMNPSYGKAYNNLGIALRSKRELKAAECQFRKSIKIAPDDSQAYHNMGNICYDQSDLETAAKWYDKAIAINPGSVQTFINRGILYQESEQTGKALECFRKALVLEPLNSKAHCHMIHELYQRCDWLQIDDLIAKIDKFTKRELDNGDRPNEMPFLNLIRAEDPLLNFQVAQRWSQDISKNIERNNKSVMFRTIPLEQKKITIGYLSNNFCNHPTSHLISDIFDLHDRSRFAINAYSYGENDGSLYREKIKKKCDLFVDLRDFIHQEAAQRIADDRVDILVDLVGYMRGNRLEICAYRSAPVQVRWLGFAGTTGADFFDYIITDRTITPMNQASFYSEKFVYLPDTYQVNSKPLKNSDQTFIRKDIGLPETGFVYCCFCSNYKIESRVFNLWMDILEKVSDSVLWILKGNSMVVRNLKKEAEKRSIDPSRIIFAEKIPKEDHLERLKLADLALDTMTVNGAATTSDALWAGVPVITVRGSHFASRMSASILSAIGLDDLILSSGEAYRQTAISFGNDPFIVNHIKQRLIINRSEKPLFDTQRFVKNLEKAYEEIWKRHVTGKKPDLIRVNES